MSLLFIKFFSIFSRLFSFATIKKFLLLLSKYLVNIFSFNTMNPIFLAVVGSLLLLMINFFPLVSFAI